MGGGHGSYAGSNPGVQPDAWATDLLTTLGRSDPRIRPTDANRRALNAWQLRESGGGGGLYNPLNTTLSGFGGDGISGQRVANYPNYDDGLAATAKALQESQYSNIREALARGNDYAGVLAAVIASPWASSHYGGHIADVSDKQAFATSPGSTTFGSSSQSTNQPTDSDCIFKLTNPGPIPNVCITRSQGRALLGAAATVAGVVVLSFGAALVVAGSKGGRQVISAVTP
jgi:hypothetical protein